MSLRWLACHDNVNVSWRVANTVATFEGMTMRMITIIIIVILIQYSGITLPCSLFPPRALLPISKHSITFLIVVSTRGPPTITSVHGIQILMVRGNKEQWAWKPLPRDRITLNLADGPDNFLTSRLSWGRRSKFYFIYMKIPRPLIWIGEAFNFRSPGPDPVGVSSQGQGM